jgi:hypothetical protein
VCCVESVCAYVRRVCMSGGWVSAECCEMGCSVSDTTTMVPKKEWFPNLNAAVGSVDIAVETNLLHNDDKIKLGSRHSFNVEVDSTARRLGKGFQIL